MFANAELFSTKFPYVCASSQYSALFTVGFSSSWQSCEAYIEGFRPAADLVNLKTFGTILNLFVFFRTIWVVPLKQAKVSSRNSLEPNL